MTVNRYQSTMTKYTAELNIVLEVLKNHPEGASNYEVCKESGLSSQLVQRLLTQLYLRTDKVYIMGYIMYSTRRRKIDIVHRYCLTEYKDGEAYLSYAELNKDDIIRVYEYDYENRKKDYEWRYRNERKFVAKKGIDVRETILSEIRSRGEIPEDEIYKTHIGWAKGSLNVLVRFGYIYKEGEVYKPVIKEE